MTDQRRVIAQVIEQAADHPDVEELYRRAVELDARISIATVYRTVRLLEERGILERRDFGGGRARVPPAGRTAPRVFVKYFGRFVKSFFFDV